MKEIKELSEVPLHLYLGCEVVTDSGLTGTLIQYNLEYQLCKIIISGGQDVSKHISEIKLRSRRLSSMTEEEKKEAHDIYYVDKIQLLAIMDVAHFELCRYLLSKGFWLFSNDAFEKGLIIDANAK